MKELKKLLLTGGAGFIGSNFISHWLACSSEHSIINLDLLSYSGNLSDSKTFVHDKRHCFVEGNIGDARLIQNILQDYEPDAVINFAAETHVDRSIHSAHSFIQTNIVGSYNFIEELRRHYSSLSKEKQKRFRFIHVSTDEVYGSLELGEDAFTEGTPYRPKNPYSASKASADHLVHSFYHTYGFPALITNSSNNYGPYQYPEKLIPLMIMNAISGKDLPIYGDGANIRDWIFVLDNCTAIQKVLYEGKLGESYNIGGLSEKTNLEVVNLLCDLLDETLPKKGGTSYKEQIAFIKDRPGHDKRYSINITKINKEVNWRPQESFESGLRKTLQWYLQNQKWVEEVSGKNYQDWLKTHYVTKEKEAGK